MTLIGDQPYACPSSMKARDMALSIIWTILWIHYLQIKFGVDSTPQLSNYLRAEFVYKRVLFTTSIFINGIEGFVSHHLLLI